MVIVFAMRQCKKFSKGVTDYHSYFTRFIKKSFNPIHLLHFNELYQIRVNVFFLFVIAEPILLMKFISKNNYLN